MNRVCWSRSAIQFATQVDVGGLEVDDARADAVFGAIHQPLPLLRVRHTIEGNRTVKSKSAASEADLLKEFKEPLNSNEPRLVLVTGQRGTGKSHLVRWLKSQVGPQPGWHIVYVAKRNTSLRKVIEQILEGIETPNAVELRRSLAKASSEIASDEEAMNALLARLDHLVAFDTAEGLSTLPDLDSSELADLRRKTHRLLGDFTFRKELSRPNGPVHRIVRLAREGAESSESPDGADLRLSEADLLVDPARFDELGAEIQNLVKALLSNGTMREDIAALCDWYLERAKTEVFTGFGTDLLQVFEDVRREVAEQQKELCLFIEDLVLLHGIDKQLAQALTVPASKRLCRLRAAIAVTEGYLDSMSTFTDRAFQFDLSIGRDAVGPQRLQDFVARYLNVGRLPDEWGKGGHRGPVGNACLSCPDLTPCHATFGHSTEGYGLYPFNGPALERLAEYANPGDFGPREILREVIRAPLETAEEELPADGLFPSSDFARTLDENRKAVPVALRTAIRRENRLHPEAEITLRALYAVSPPATDIRLERIASYLGVGLTPVDDGPTGQPESTVPGPTGITGSADSAGPDEFEEWALGKKLSAPAALIIRKWVSEAAIDQLQNGPYGLAIRRPTKQDWQIGSHTMRPTDVFIADAMGKGALRAEIEFKIELSDENAVMLRGITTAARKGGRLDLVDNGGWYFRFQAMLTDFVSRVAAAGAREGTLSLSKSCQVLAVLSNADHSNPQGLREMLPAMLMPKPPAQINPTVQAFLKDTQGIRGTALTAIRDLATTSRRGGAPSVLDVGLMYPDLKAPARLRALDGDYDGNTDALATMQSLQVKQDRAFKKVWSDVHVVLAKVAQYLAPSEEFARALDLVDRAVNDGHMRDALPRSDSRELYVAARQKVTPAAMEAYTKLSTKSATNPGPGAIWDVLNDPIPHLEALARWAMMAHQCLAGIEARIAANSGAGGGTDAGMLIHDFRELAGVLDMLAK